MEIETSSDPFVAVIYKQCVSTSNSKCSKTPKPFYCQRLLASYYIGKKFPKVSPNLGLTLPDLIIYRWDILYGTETEHRYQK